MTDAPVFTGMATVAPNGLTTDDWWEATKAGTSALDTVSRFDASGYPGTVAGEVRGWDPADDLPSRLVPQTDRATRLSLVATERALADAGVDPEDSDTLQPWGIVTAATAGGYEFGQGELQHLWADGPSHVSAYQSFAWFYPVNTGQASIRHDLRGPGGAVVADGAGGLDALGLARRRLRHGTPGMVSGGFDATVCPWGWAAHVRSGKLSPDTDPERAYRPFDADASGYVPGEGGATLIMEGPSAERKPRQRYGRLAGHAARFSPAGDPLGGKALARAATAALQQAGARPTDIDIVFADAAGDADADAAEAAVITELFGPAAVPVTAPKAGTGRLGAGGPAVDVAAALLAICDGVIPPTPNSTGCPGIDLVTEAREMPVGTVLVLARGRHGFASAAVITEA